MDKVLSLAKQRVSWCSTSQVFDIGDMYEEQIGSMTCYLVGLSEGEQQQVQRLLKQGEDTASMDVVVVKDKMELKSEPNSLHPIDLLCLGLDDAESGAAPYPGNLDVLWFLALHGHMCPWVAFVEQAQHFPESLCRAMGASGYLTRPLNSEMVAAALEQGLHPSARPTSFPLVLFLQIAHTLRVSGQIQITSRELEEQGVLGLEQGELRYAIWGEETSGEEILRRFLSWPDMRYEILKDSQVEEPNHNFQEPWKTLLARLFPAEKALDSSTQKEEPASPSAPAPFLSESSPQATSREPLSADFLNETCRTVLEELGNGIACGVVDLTQQRLIGKHQNDAALADEFWSTTTAMIHDMFQGNAIQQLENVLAGMEGHSQDKVEDLLVHTDNEFLFMKSLLAENAVVFLMTNKSTSQGMVLTHLRSAAETIQAKLT